MKLNLALPSTQGEYRLLFSNIGRDDLQEFYLLMVFHRSRKGGFDYLVTEEDCRKALARRDKGYKFIKEVNS